MKVNQKGFSVFQILIVVVMIGLVGAVGWLVYDRQKTKVNTNKDTAQSKTPEITYCEKVTDDCYMKANKVLVQTGGAFKDTSLNIEYSLIENMSIYKYAPSLKVRLPYALSGDYKYEEITYQLKSKNTAEGANVYIDVYVSNTKDWEGVASGATPLVFTNGRFYNATSKELIKDLYANDEVQTAKDLSSKTELFYAYKTDKRQGRCNLYTTLLLGSEDTNKPVVVSFRKVINALPQAPQNSSACSTTAIDTALQPYEQQFDEIYNTTRIIK